MPASHPPLAFLPTIEDSLKADKWNTKNYKNKRHISILVGFLLKKQKYHYAEGILKGEIRRDGDFLWQCDKCGAVIKTKE